MKRFLHDNLVRELLHRYQMIAVALLVISIIVFFTIWDFTHTFSVIILAIIASLLIFILAVGLIWLVDDFNRFAKTYKQVNLDNENKKKSK